MAKAAPKTEKTEKTETKGASLEVVRNKEELAREEMIAAGLLSPEEADDFAVVNPELDYYKAAALVENSAGEKVERKYAIRGIPLARRERPKAPDDERQGHYYVFVLTAPATLFSREGEPVEASRGDFAWVDERYALRCLATHLPRTTKDEEGVESYLAVTEVIIRPTSKIALKGGRSLWKFDIRARNLSAVAATGIVALTAPAALPMPAEPPPAEGDDLNGEIPF